MELWWRRPYVPQSTLETDFPLPLCSDQYVTLRGPHRAPVLKQAVRWKCTPMGRDAVGQSWSTGLSSWSESEDAWYALPRGGAPPAFQRWQQAHARRERERLPPAYAQRLREAAWWDPVIPAQYLGLGTRWGAFLWREKPTRGKEYVVTRNWTRKEPGGSLGYVPGLSFCRPPFTTRDVCTWSHLHHQPSTRQ
ncbi:tektin bundle-interacting protein 1 isoform X2 [Rhea pennata]|uniref:tektin bundle-interacting protein 1 isoform X2 n=1 Tax=Rhea pennata TaxID=8795 RepID=UPI002E25C14D